MAKNQFVKDPEFLKRLDQPREKYDPNKYRRPDGSLPPHIPGRDPPSDWESIKFSWPFIALPFYILIMLILLIRAVG